MIYGDEPETDDENKPLTPDYSSIIQSINLYPYCANNPVVHVDSNGEFFKYIVAFFKSLSFDVGVGVGIGAKANIGTTTAGLEYGHNTYTLGVENDQTYAGTSGNFTASLGIIGYETHYIHKCEEGSNKYRDEHNSFSSPGAIWSCSHTEFSSAIVTPIYKVVDGDAVVNIGISAYLGIGGSANVGFNLSKFYEELND